MARTQVVHVDRGFKMSVSYALQVMRDHCSIVWVAKGETVRDATDEERMAMRANQVKQESANAALPAIEGPGLKFATPKTTRYRAPRAAYDAQEWMILGHRCRWPRAA